MIFLCRAKALCGLELAQVFRRWRRYGRTKIAIDAGIFFVSGAAVERHSQYGTHPVGFKKKSPTRRRRRNARVEQYEYRRTLYHLGFARTVNRGAPPGVKLEVEYPLSWDSRRIDQRLVRSRGKKRDDEAEVLRGLWRHLGEQTLLDFKGPTRGFRRGELIRLISYGGEYLASRTAEFDSPSELSLVLVVPKLTPSLSREIEWMGLGMEPLEDGYARLVGSRYTMIVVFLDRVSEQEKNLEPFTDAKKLDKEVAHRTLAWILEVAQMEDIRNLEGLDDLLDKLVATLGPDLVLRHLALEERLAGLDPEKVLDRFSPEERLAGLEPEERLAGLEPEERLAGLEPEQLARALRSLPQEVQETIRRKLNGS